MVSEYHRKSAIIHCTFDGKKKSDYTFCREMVLIVHGFPNDISALRVSYKLILKRTESQGIRNLVLLNILL